MSSDAVISEIGQKMLSGWRMLGSSCPMCYTVLLQEKGDNKRYCCSCKAFLVTEEEAKQHNLTFSDAPNSAPTTSTTPSQAPTESKTPVQPKPTAPALPSMPKPSLTPSTTTAAPVSKPSRPAVAAPAGSALVDDDFENEQDEADMNFAAIQGSYADLKSMYSKLMSGSSALLDDLNNSQQAAPTRAHGASKTAQQEQQGDGDESDDFSAISSSLRKLLNGLPTYDNEGEADEDFEDIEYDPSGGFLASFLSQHDSAMQPVSPSARESKGLLDGTAPGSNNSVNIKNDEQGKKKYTRAAVPPNPDDDWEYYNSHDTDLVTDTKIGKNGQIINKDSMERAQKEFSDKVLSGWIFSSHTCENCEQILLFPPSTTFSPEDVVYDVIDRFNASLALHHNISPKTALTENDIDLDTCEFIRGLCTCCGWFCILDDADTPTGIDYIPTITHDCCLHSNLADQVIRQVMQVQPHKDQAQAAPSVPSSTTSTASTNPHDDWSNRIQAAMNNSIRSQTKSNTAYDTEYSKLSQIPTTLNLTTPSTLSAKDYDIHNFSGLEETARLLNSSDVAEKMKHLDSLSKLLGKALSQGKMILDEYCPDCIIPLVGLNVPSDMVDPHTGKFNTTTGIKLHHDLYATMPKECVLCQQTWNIDDGANKQQTPAPKPAQAPQQPQPQQQQAPLPPRSQPQSQAPPQVPPKPSHHYPQPSPQQYQPQQPQRPQPKPQVQQPTASSLSHSLQNHIAALEQSLDTITNAIVQCSAEIAAGAQNFSKLTELMNTSAALSAAIATCQNTIDQTK